MTTLKNIADSSSRPYKVTINKDLKYVLINSKHIPFDLFLDVCKGIEGLRAGKLLKPVPNKYRALNKADVNKVISNPYYYNGITYAATINNREVTGRICVSDSRIYFCSDNTACNGSTAPNKYGYRYSWALDSAVDDIRLMAVSFKDAETYSGEYKKTFSKTLDRLEKITAYKSQLSDSHLKIGCNTFRAEEILAIGKEIKGEDKVDVNKEIVSVFLKDLSKVQETIEGLKKSIESILSTKPEKLKSGVKRDSSGRFV